MANYIITNNGLLNADSISHHGVKGMKWGVRRYQNKDGSLTPAGKKRQKEPIDPERKKKIIKRVVAGAALAATVAGAAYYVSKNPAAVTKVASMLKNSTTKVGSLSKAAVSKGKAYTKTALKTAKVGVKEGIKEAVKEAPKKAAKAVITGITLNAVKRSLDATVGKEESARIFQANDGKKIGKFWKVSDDDRDD